MQKQFEGKGGKVGMAPEMGSLLAQSLLRPTPIIIVQGAPRDSLSPMDRMLQHMIDGCLLPETSPFQISLLDSDEKQGVPKWRLG